MEPKKVRKKISITETFAIVLVIIVIAGYFYWRVFGISPIDNQVKQFIDSNYLLSVILSLLVFGILFFISYVRYKKGKKFELINLGIYTIIALIFVLYFASDFI